jgi:hypothetical protein
VRSLDLDGFGFGRQNGFLKLLSDEKGCLREKMYGVEKFLDIIGGR